MDRAAEFETQHKLLLLETLFDAGRSLGKLPDENRSSRTFSGGRSESSTRRADTLRRSAKGASAGRRRVSGFRAGFPNRWSRTTRFSPRSPARKRPCGGTDSAFCEASVGARRRDPGGRADGGGAHARRQGNSPGREGGVRRRGRRFLSSLAGLAGMAIENRRHLQRLTRERERLEEENRRLLDATGRSAAGRVFVGESLGARRVLDLVARVAPSRTSVLITGESGTGKELVARMIHGRSDRADGPFIAINCAALPESLLESELFGIERGVATGVDARQGRLEAADGGTLFLDEIGDMPPSPVQAAARSAGTADRARRRPRGIPIDVRVIAATNARLSGRISSGQFREDLYYRLRVVEIALPPLRERREDIPKLARHFLERFAAGEGREPLRSTGRRLPRSFPMTSPATSASSRICSRARRRCRAAGSFGSKTSSGCRARSLGCCREGRPAEGEELEPARSRSGTSARS